MALLDTIRSYAEERIQEFDQIPEDRRALLEDIAAFVRSRRRASEPAQLTYVCTHNSRRSHIARIWAQAAADHFGVKGVVTFSGGTEVTAFHPNAVDAMRRIGFEIEGNEKASNPRYRVRFATTLPPLIAVSKVYNDGENPRENFAAVMVCSSADEACPVIPGTMARIAVTYDDPKSSDDTDKMEAVYDERTRQIAREMLYCFSTVGPLPA